MRWSEVEQRTLQPDNRDKCRGTGDRSEKNALGEELSDQSQAAGANCETNGHFALPVRGAREK